MGRQSARSAEVARSVGDGEVGGAIPLGLTKRRVNCVGRSAGWNPVGPARGCGSIPPLSSEGTAGWLATRFEPEGVVMSHGSSTLLPSSMESEPAEVPGLPAKQRGGASRSGASPALSSTSRATYPPSTPRPTARRPGRFRWYAGRDSNPHARRHWLLRPARLPTPPPARALGGSRTLTPFRAPAPQAGAPAIPPRVRSGRWSRTTVGGSKDRRPAVGRFPSARRGSRTLTWAGFEPGASAVGLHARSTSLEGLGAAA